MNDPNITFRQLQVFLAVARHENLGRASEELHLSKGAVSQSLSELESQLGVRLFDRVRSHIYLNHEGKRLVPQADELSRRVRDIGLMFSGEDGDRFLAVGASKTIASSVLPRLLKSFEQASSWLPEAQVANSRDLCDLVASFALDAALVESETEHPELTFEPWLEDRMVVAAQRGHPLADGRKHPVEALRSERWILREADSGTRQYFECNLAPLLRPGRRTAFTLSSPQTILGMVGEGLGITFISGLLASQPEFGARHAVIRLDREFSRTFSLCWHPLKYHSLSMAQFLEYCRAWNPENAGD